MGEIALNGLIVTGCPRSGTTLLYCMLRYTVSNYEFHDNETDAVLPGVITKAPQAVFSLTPEQSSHVIVVLRDPREVLTSVHLKFRGYFVSAHFCANRPSKGLCEWWAAIKSLPDAYRVRYEDLIADPRRIQREIGERFGLDYHEGRYFDEFHQADHGPTWELGLNGRRPLARRALLDDARLSAQFTAFPELHTVRTEMGYA